jgi:hypothetical protein
VPSSFFSEQLTAFELWLAHGSADKKPPEQLPIVLQVRLSGLLVAVACTGRGVSVLYQVWGLVAGLAFLGSADE